jgi:hypothetical protein
LPGFFPASCPAIHDLYLRRRADVAIVLLLLVYGGCLRQPVLWQVGNTGICAAATIGKADLPISITENKGMMRNY